MPVKWSVEDVVAQASDGTWGRRRVSVVQRLRFRVVSDQSTQRRQQRGNGEEVELIVDSSLDVWVRPWGEEGPFKKDADARGVTVIVSENLTYGVEHRVAVVVRPSDEDAARWSCTCGRASRGWIRVEEAQTEADAHARYVADREAEDKLLHERMMRAAFEGEPK